MNNHHENPSQGNDPLVEALEQFDRGELLILYRGESRGVEPVSDLNSRRWTIDPFQALFDAGIWGVDDAPESWGRLTYTVVPTSLAARTDASQGNYRLRKIPFGSRCLVPYEIDCLLANRVIFSQSGELPDRSRRHEIGQQGVIKNHR